MFVKG